MSLKKELNEWIKCEQFVSYNDVEVYCKENYYRIETATRRLRKSESPNVKAVFKKTYITGWKYVAEPKQEVLNL